MHQNKKLTIVILVILTATISVVSVTYFYISGFNPLYEYDNSIDDSPTNSNYWEDKFYEKVDEYYDLAENYNNLRIEYEYLEENCGSIVNADSNPPSTVIKNGTIYWNFYTLDSSVSTWSVPVETYRGYITYPKPAYEFLYLDNYGETLTTYDIRDYIQPDFFSKVISGLTDGRNAKEFVGEVVNVKNQLISYGSLESDEEHNYRWAMETLTEGQGNCGDTTILMASLLKAGEEQKNYGIDVYIWYCDAYNMSNPQVINHVIIGVEYPDGDYDLIETTSNYYYSYDEIIGWKFEV